MTTYTVVVGNLGLVWEGNNLITARAVHKTYTHQSLCGIGRVAYEPVTLLRDGDIYLEHPGALYDHA